MKSSNTYLLIKLVYWLKSVLSNIFDPAGGGAGHMRINLEAAGRNSKLKSRDKNSVNKMNIINRNRKLQTSKAPLKSQAQDTSLFTSAASNQRGFPKNSPWEAQVRFPEGERMRQIRGVFQRIVRGKLRSGCQKVRGGRLGVKAGVV